MEPFVTWSIDFVSDVLECGRKFRVLNIIDDSDRVAVAQEVSMSFPAHRAIKVLEKVIWFNGKPRNIRCDNCPEFIAKEFQEWCAANNIRLLYRNLDVRHRTVISSASTAAIAERFWTLTSSEPSMR